MTANKASAQSSRVANSKRVKIACIYKANKVKTLALLRAGLAYIIEPISSKIISAYHPLSDLWAHLSLLSLPAEVTYLYLLV